MRNIIKATYIKIISALICVVMLAVMVPVNAAADGETADAERKSASPVTVSIMPLMLSAAVDLDITRIYIDLNEQDEADIVTPGLMTIENLSAVPIDIAYSDIEYAGIWENDSVVPNTGIHPDTFMSYTKNGPVDNDGNLTGQVIKWSELGQSDTQKYVAFAMREDDGTFISDMLPGMQFNIGRLESKFSDNNELRLLVDMKTGYAWDKSIEHKYNVTLMLGVFGDNEETDPPDDKFMFEIYVDAGETYTSPVRDGSVNGTDIINYDIDWGDGSHENVTIPEKTHTYTDAGSYVVSIKPNTPYCGFISFSGHTALRKVLTPLPRVIRNFGGSISATFSGCTNLISVPYNLFYNTTGTTVFNEVFRNCISLTSIPAGLFDNSPEVYTFRLAFENCTSLTSIPPGLFDNNPKVTSFHSTFYGCSGLISVPAGLFDYNTKVTEFNSAFRDCTSLISIPADLFVNNSDATSFYRTFRDCRNLTGQAPEIWVSHSTADGTQCFRNANYLSNYSSIPYSWK